MERAGKNFKLGHSDPTLLERTRVIYSSVVVTREPPNICDFVAKSKYKKNAYQINLPLH